MGQRGEHSRLTRRSGLRQLRLLEMLEQQRQRAIENRSGIAVGGRGCASAHCASRVTPPR
jgi:hypothetical protein